MSEQQSNTMKKNNNKEGDEVEMVRETRFVSGSTYEGSWDAIDKTGIGRYVTPYS